MEKCFEGKTALVVGGSGGIGAELSLALAQEGAKLVIHGGHKSEKFDLLAKKIENLSGKKPEMLVHNLLESDFSSLERSELLDAAKNCDILCVCFGPFVQKSLHETALCDWKNAALFDYALPGVLVSAALPGMMAKKWGRILLFGGTGTSFREEFSTNAAYAGAKSGLNVLTASVAAFYAEYGITCNLICPGFTETEYLSERLKSELSKKMPMETMIKSSSIAEIALFLLKNADINGATLRSDRGWSTLKAPLK